MVYAIIPEMDPFKEIKGDEQQNILYVILDLEKPLLGRPAIEALEIITVNSAVHSIRDSDE